MAQAASICLREKYALVSSVLDTKTEEKTESMYVKEADE